MEEIRNEAVAALLAELALPEDHYSPALRALAATDARSLRDLKRNLDAVLGSAGLNRREAYLLALAVAVNERHSALTAAFERLARNEGADDGAIAETCACVSVTAANNVFHRFRRYLPGNDFYNSTPAGLRMSVMLSPALGRELFELMSLLLSAVNCCERCVASHEASARQQGAAEARIYDAVRLGAVVKGLCVVI